MTAPRAPLTNDRLAELRIVLTITIRDALKGQDALQTQALSEIDRIIEQAREANALREFISRAFEVYPNLDLDISAARSNQRGDEG